MLRIVVDTNVFVSGIISPNSPPAQILQLWQSHRFRLVSCKRALDELDDVLQRPHLAEKYHITSPKREKLLTIIREGIIMVEGNSVSGVVPDDPKDDMFVACAFESRAKYIVSGDKHLLRMRRYGVIRILEPAFFL